METKDSRRNPGLSDQGQDGNSQQAQDEAAADFRVRIVVVIGTRPEAIKLFPVILALQESPHLVPYVVLTGQHRDMVQPVLDLAGITPDADLGVGRSHNTLNGLVVRVVEGLDRIVTDLRAADPEREIPMTAACLVHGDTTSAFAAALAAVHRGLPVAHVEAGLRTGDILSPFPEELNRQLIARIACLNFAPIKANLANLARERVDVERIYVTGNTGIDALLFAADRALAYTDTRLEQFTSGSDPLIVVTAHRRENWGGGIEQVALGVADVARARPDVRFVVSMHPNPSVRDELLPPLAGLPNVLCVEPVDYPQFARLLKAATLVITDSGGIQEEAPAVGTPVLVARDDTERFEGVEAGTLKLVGADRARIATETLRLLDDPVEYQKMVAGKNPYGDGMASKRIAGALENLAVGAPQPPPFGPSFSRSRVLERAGYEDLPPSPAEEAPDSQPVGLRPPNKRDQFGHRVRSEYGLTRAERSEQLGSK